MPAEECIKDRLVLTKPYQRIFNEEKWKIGLGYLEILLFRSDDQGVRKHDGNYELTYANRDLRSLEDFRQHTQHELAHIAAGHCENIPTNPIIRLLKYLYIYEEVAQTYRNFGFRLGRFKLSLPR